jgi:hypothetical protein
MTIKYTTLPYNRPKIHICDKPTLSNPRPSKNYPNWDFGLKVNHLATLFKGLLDGIFLG